jgi:hypothetical protein
MRSIPTWKIIREIRRLKSQVEALFSVFYEPALRTKQRVRRLAPQYQIDGLIAGKPKVAVFLIYQPNGIANSTFKTCQHLVDSGYSPLVVVNGHICAADIDRLRTWSWKVFLRENIGYDFGGYQDAIWLLNHHEHHTDQLVILNDSVWFPALTASNILQSMESSASDLTGALQLEAYRAEYTNGGSKPPFFGSFFIHIKGTALRHGAFSSFWSNYKATSNKYVTIRRGERGFSRALIEAGISHAYMYSRRMFDAWIMSSSNGDLVETLSDLVSMNPQHQKRRQDLIDSQSPSIGWRNSTIALALEMTEKQNILSSAPITSLKQFGVPYIKKSADPHNLLALGLIARRHREGIIELDQSVYTEMTALLAKHGLTDN